MGLLLVIGVFILAALYAKFKKSGTPTTKHNKPEADDAYLYASSLADTPDDSGSHHHHHHHHQDDVSSTHHHQD